MHRLQEEVTVALRARKYEQKIKKHPSQRLDILKKAQKRVTRHGFREEPLTRVIIRKGPKLLEEIIPKDREAKGRRTITRKLFRDLEGSILDRIMTKVEALQTAFYLRFGYRYQP